MACHPPHLLRRLTPVALACALLVPPLARAQAGDGVTPSQLPAVRVTGQSPTSRAGVAGFGDVPLARSPLQAKVLTLEALKEQGATRLSDITSVDASISDAYNAEGYWDNLTVRGYTLDNRFNYRRDGLPISGETSIPLDNKAAIEILKGTSGIQAGTSAPGGLVNYVVKRPEGRIRSVELGWRSRGSVRAGVDLGDRFGADERFGLRVNAAYEHLEPQLHDAEGHRRIVAVAGDWRLSPDTWLEAEVESSERRQPSQAGFSLRGNDVPEPDHPRTNLNNQPWSQPVVMQGDTASLRLRHRFSPEWQGTAHFGTQRLHMDDRMAFPLGLYDPVSYECNPCDRFTEDGRFTVWEYVSDNERRRTDALNLYTDGRFATGTLQHQLTAGVLLSRYKTRVEPQIYEIAGVGTDDGQTEVPPSVGMLYPGRNRTERSTEWYLRDAIELNPQWSAWLGLRHTRLHRESVQTDGTEATDYDQSFSTPWAALSYQFMPQHMAYVSWGRGSESEVVANRSDRYLNAGETLRPLKSRQVEVGVKATGTRFDWSVNLFDIDRPVAGCSPTPCTWAFDGSARHRGVEAAGAMRVGAWRLDASAMLLDAEREGSRDPAVNGKRPANVPKRSLKAQARYAVPQVTGLSVLAAAVYEGNRMAHPDNSARIGGWTRYDMAVLQEHRWQGTTLRWRAGVTNLFDKQAWRESAYQFNHVYLYPLAPRSFQLSLQADL
ncbi:TonB-dependent siderophore receptor [Caldimonas brevitalea]|nr:TonB-dependent siderophore receptor [Caldimonas brevitalea]